MIPKIINAEFELNEMQWTTRTTTRTVTAQNEESEIDGMDCFGLDWTGLDGDMDGMKSEDYEQ